MRGQTLEVLAGRGDEPLRGEARSGAKINAVLGDADTFIDTFPQFFRDESDRERFKSGIDETPATRLFGENPATFPTITERTKHFIGPEGRSTHLVLINGGINDLGFENFLDPEGPAFAGRIEEIFGIQLRGLLERTRATFPVALIIVVGYYSALSNMSDHEALADLLKYMSKKPHWQIEFNDFLQDLPGLSDFANLIGAGKDVDALVDQAVARSLAAAAHAHFWTRKTIDSLPSNIAGSGVIYAHPAFEAEHALFARLSLVYERYRLPTDGGQIVDDEMLPIRLSTIPRQRNLSVYVGIRRRLGSRLLAFPGNPFPSFDFLGDRRELLSALRPLLQQPDLPPSLRQAAETFITSFDHDIREQDWLEDRNHLRDIVRAILTDLRRAVEKEIARIEVATIASFLHPTDAGTDRYADRIVKAYSDSRSFSLGILLDVMSEDGRRPFSVRKLLRSNGVNPSRGLRCLSKWASIQSVAIEISGIRAWTGLVTVYTFELGQLPPLNVALFAGTKHIFKAFDVIATAFTHMRGMKIKGLKLDDFEELTVYLNGIEFSRFVSSRGRKMAMGAEFDLTD